MVVNSTATPTSRMTKLCYPILLEPVSGGWIVSIPGWVEARAVGTSREGAVDSLRQWVSQRLQESITPTGEFSQLELDFPCDLTNPILHFAGMFADDPAFDSMMEHLEAFRQEDREAYFRQLDAEEVKE